MTSGPRHYGKYRATVLNNLDPMLRGRIQVQLGDRYGPFPSTWAEPAFPFAGKGAAMVALPQMGSSVWIEFEAGDSDYPIWSGAFWPEEEAGFPPLALAGATPASPNIHFQTVSGNSVTLSDNPAQQVFVKTAGGAMITIGAAGITITNGQGASIAMVGPSVIINNGALTIT